MSFTDHPPFNYRVRSMLIGEPMRNVYVGSPQETLQAAVDELYGPSGDERGHRWTLSATNYLVFIDNASGSCTRFSSLVRDGLVIDPRDRDAR